LRENTFTMLMDYRDFIFLDITYSKTGS
jgi:hypothetical protein